MYKIASILLTFTILFQSFSFDLEDINKIPTLINHISCHIEKGDSLGDFLSMHYGGEASSHEKDNNEHQKLPFKHQHLDSHFQIVFIFNPSIFNVDKREPIFEKEIFNYKESSTIFIQSSIFQPPKAA